MLRDSIDMVIRLDQAMDTQRIHQEQLIEYVLQFPHGRIANLAKRENL